MGDDLYILIFSLISIQIFIISIIKIGSIFLTKGYSPTKVTILSILYFIVFFILGLFILAFSKSMLGYLFAIFVGIIYLFSSLVIYLFIGKKISVKETKKYGKREIPFIYKIGSIIIPLILIGFPLVFLYVIIFPDKQSKPIKWYDYLRIFTLLTVLQGYFILQRKKLLFKRQKEITDYINKDFKVLFLRSFYLDKYTFAQADIKKKNEFGDLIKFQTHSDFLGKSAPLNFEEYFGNQVYKHIGEMVCIGDPKNRIPMEGIIDLYPKSTEWQNFVLKFIEKSEIILMYIGSSNHILFELKAIMNSGAISKLCIITEPIYIQTIEKANIFKRFKEWPQLMKKPTPQNLKNILNDAGLKINFIPENGAVIVFDENNIAKTLISGCKLPSEYVMAIKKHFYN